MVIAEFAIFPTSEGTLVSRLRIDHRLDKEAIVESKLKAIGKK
ncbi:MAG: hypothetical protein WCB96_01530 [Candidatus Aminicenantales bacterium]